MEIKKSVLQSPMRRTKQLTEFNISERSVIIAKGNNPELIEKYFEMHKWNVLKHTSLSFTRYQLKWVNSPQEIDFSYF